MALIQCPECGKRVSSFAENCPECGYPIARRESNEPTPDPSANEIPENLQTYDYLTPSDDLHNSSFDNKQNNDPEYRKKSTYGNTIPRVIFKVLVTIGIIFLGIAVIMTVNTNNINSSASSNYTSSAYSNGSSTDRSMDAWICAEKAVEDNLKAPSSSDFCSYTEADITSLGANQYRIEGYVDAENGFGSKLRKNFVVTLTLTEEGFRDYTVSFN